MSHKRPTCKHCGDEGLVSAREDEHTISSTLVYCDCPAGDKLCNEDAEQLLEAKYGRET